MISIMPSAEELKYFIEVAHTLNVSRAAERLGLSQPSLSLAIQRLENTLGIPLLIRSKSGVRLTRGGQRFAAQARELITDWERLRRLALQNESEINGRYTLGCHSSVALFSLDGFIPQLLQAHPALEFKFVHDLSRKILEEIVSFKTDFGIVVNPAKHPDLVIKPLFTDEVTFWTSSNSKIHLQDPFSGKTVLICDPELVQTQSLLKQVAKKGMKFDRIITSSNLEVITSLVSAGAGIGVLPTRVATRIPSQGLKHAHKNYPRFTDQICLVYRADAQRSKGSKVLIRAMESLIRTLH